MLSASLSDVTFAFLDIETTGLDPHMGDRICEIAVLKIRDDRVIGRLETLVNPGRAIPPKAVSINGITNDLVKGSIFFRDIAWSLLDFLKDTVIVAHNASFDLEFLFMELSALNLTPFENEVIDTLSIARRHYDFPSNSLGKIAKQLGIPTAGEHRAYGDAAITREVFKYFTMDLSRRGKRIRNLKDILKLQKRPVSYNMTKQLVLPPAIEEALRARGKIQIKYLSAYKDTASIRIIEPLEFKLSGSYKYLLAFCHQRKENCRFRLDRILEVKTVS